MDGLNVTTGLHDRLSIEVPESDFARLTTLGLIVAYVASGQPEHAPAPWAATAEASAQVSCTRHLVIGTLVVVRPDDDMPLEADFVRHLSKETRYKRSMETLRELPQAELIHLTDVDQFRHVALVAIAECQGQHFMVGVVCYSVDPANTGCAISVAVDDAWQGCGLAGILMHALMDVARSRALTIMEGIVLTTNGRMLNSRVSWGSGRNATSRIATGPRCARTLTLSLD